MERVSTSIRISKDTLEELKQQAKESDRSVSYIINNIINKHIEASRKE